MFCFIQIMFFFYDNPHYSVVSNKKYYNHQALLYIPCTWKKQKTSCYKYPCFENLGLSTALKFYFHFSWGNTEKINNQRHCKGRHFHFDRLWQIFQHLRKSTQSRNICHSLSKSNCYPLQCLWILIFKIFIFYFLFFEYFVGIKAKGQISKRIFKKIKRVPFSEKRKFFTPWYAQVRVHNRG